MADRVSREISTKTASTASRDISLTRDVSLLEDSVGVDGFLQKKLSTVSILSPTGASKDLGADLLEKHKKRLASAQEKAGNSQLLAFRQGLDRDDFGGGTSSMSMGLRLPRPKPAPEKSGTASHGTLGTFEKSASIMDIVEQMQNEGKKEDKKEDKSGGEAQGPGYCPVDISDTSPELWGFDYKPEEEKETFGLKTQYTWTREHRASLTEKLGISANSGGGATKEIEGVIARYEKADVSQTINLFFYLIAGSGLLIMPRALHDTGLVCGVAVLFGCIFFQMFLCQLLAEVPALIEQNLENYSGIHRILAGSLGVGARRLHLVVYSVVFAWAAQATVNLRFLNELVFLRDHADEFTKWMVRQSGLGSTAVVLAWVLYAIPFLFLMWIFAVYSREVKDIQRATRYAKMSLSVLAVCFIIIRPLSALLQVSCDSSPNPKCFVDANVTDSGNTSEATEWYLRWLEGQAWDDVNLILGNNISRGVCIIVLAVFGVAALPYVVAEMADADSDNAKVVINACSRRILIGYTLYGCVGYIVWGNLLGQCEGYYCQQFTKLEDDRQLVTNESWHYLWMTILQYVLEFSIVLKVISCFILSFWPLMCEFEVQFQNRKDPTLEIQLPWAQASARRRDLVFRFCVALLLNLALFVPDQYWSYILGFLIYLPVVASHMLTPARIAWDTIWLHRAILIMKEERYVTMSRLRFQGYTPSTEFQSWPKNNEMYCCSRFGVHLFVVRLAVIFSFIVVLAGLTDWSCDFLQAVHSDQFVWRNPGWSFLDKEEYDLTWWARPFRGDRIDKVCDVFCPLHNCDLSGRQDGSEDENTTTTIGDSGDSTTTAASGELEELVQLEELEVLSDWDIAVKGSAPPDLVDS